MSTAAVLEAMTDRALFERLATGVLRFKSPELAGLLHTGMNAQGEAVRDPVDGFHRIPGSSPPVFCFVQHTTTDRNSLERKWLTAKDADLVKAAQQAELIRAEIPDANFHVVLSTNQHVSSALATKVHVYAENHELEVDLWEQSRYSDFLDHTPDGHWLRQSYLGIRAERLSHGLLTSLAKESRSQYRKHVLFGTSMRAIQTEACRRANQATQVAMPGAVLVWGSSGLGKSFAILEALDAAAERGSIALWLPPTFVDAGERLESALSQWLIQLHPGLESGAGQVAISLCSPAEPLRVCIDDIQRVRDPDSAVASLLAQVSSKQDDPGDLSRGAPAPNVLLVLPLWPDRLERLSSKLLNQDRIRKVQVTGFSRNEVETTLGSRFRLLTGPELRRCADALANDPFAVGAFVDSVSPDVTAQVAELHCANVLDALVQEAIKRCVARASGSLIRADVDQALLALGHCMLAAMEVSPRWERVLQFVAEQTHRVALRHLFGDGFLCTEGGSSEVLFRHDRVRDYILARSASQLIQNDEDCHVLHDPYYAAIAARGLILAGLHPEAVRAFCDSNPLAIAFLIQLLGRSLEIDSPAGKVILQWAEGFDWRAHKELAWAFTVRFLSTDSLLVPALVELLPPNARRKLAAFRNGSAASGAAYFGAQDRDEIEPAWQDHTRDAAVEQAFRYHLESLDIQIRSVDITTLDPKSAAGYFAVIGYLRLQGSGDLMRQLYQRAPGELLPDAAWAACRSQDDDGLALAKELLQVLCEGEPVPNELRDATPLDYARVALTRSFRNRISDDLVDWIVSKAMSGSVFASRYALLLTYVDHPNAVECLARHLGSYLMTESWGTLQGIGDGDITYNPRGSASQERLLRLWKDPAVEHDVRVTAFCMWLRAAPSVDIEQLRAIPENSPFYKYALQHRIKLGDTTASRPLAALLIGPERRGIWWNLAHRVWSEQLEVTAHQEIERQSDAKETQADPSFYWLAVLCVGLPVDVATKLFSAHWDVVSRDDDIVGAALRVATDECLKLARVRMEHHGNPLILFRKASRAWHRRAPHNPVTPELLRRVLPFLEQWPEDQLASVVSDLFDNKQVERPVRDFAREHLEPLLKELKQPLMGSIGWALECLDKELGSVRPFVRHIFQSAPGSDLSIEQAYEWYLKYRTREAYRVLVECVLVAGTRHHLAYLEDGPKTGDAVEATELAANARFAVMSRSLR